MFISLLFNKIQQVAWLRYFYKTGRAKRVITKKIL